MFSPKSTNQSGERNEHLPDLCFSIWRFSQVVFIPRSQPHAQSLFLFPIVFCINLIHFFDEKKDSQAGNSIVCFWCFDPLSRHLTEATKKANCFEERNVFGKGKCELSAIKEGSPRKRCKFLARKSAELFTNTKVHILVRKSAKLIAHFSATKVTPLPSLSPSPSLSLSLSLSLTVSLSLSLSLSRLTHLTHNTGSASALPIIWRPQLFEPAAERKRRPHGRRPTFKSAYPDPQILPQCNISSNYSYNVWFFWVSRDRFIILVKKWKHFWADFEKF